MDGILYPASLVVLALAAFNFNQSGNKILALISVAIAIYIVYSHETGHTVTEFKNEMVHSIDESAGNFSKSRGTTGYDESDSMKILEKEKK